MSSRILLRAALQRSWLVIPALVLVACGEATDPVQPPTVGRVAVSVAATGADLDDAYAVRLGAGRLRTIIAAETVTFDSVAPGRQSLALRGIADNCTGVDSTRTVEVTAGETATVSFPVACAAIPRGLTTVSQPVAEDTIDARPTTILRLRLIHADGRRAAGSAIHLVALARTAPGGAIVPGMLMSGGMEFADSVQLTTDSLGYAEASVRFGGITGATGIVMRAPALGVQDTMAFTVLPGRTEWFRVDMPDTALYVGNALTVRFRAGDRNGNRHAVTPSLRALGAELSVSEYRVTANAIANAAVVAEMPGLEPDTLWVGVVPRGTIAVRVSGGTATMRLDGSEYRFLGRTDDLGLAWAHDGSALLLSNGSVVIRLSPDGMVVTGVSWSDQPVMWPAPSSDGAWVYFLTQPSWDRRTLWRVEATGGVADSVHTFSRGDIAFEKATIGPSPDGSRLAYGGGDGNLLKVLDVATGVTTLLSSSPSFGTGAQWSPDGTRIAFKGYNGIHVVNPDGTGHRFLNGAPAAWYDDYRVSWSPDGQWLVHRGQEFIELTHATTGLTIPLRFTIPMAQPAWRPGS